MNPKKKFLLIGAILIILHIVGAIGCVIEYTRPLMLMLTPLNLLISAGFLIYCNPHPYLKTLLFLFISGLIGFFVEMIGVKTGWIFGSYSYGNTLGLKLEEVPLIIGINWFMLSFIFGNIVSRLPLHIFGKVTLAALFMTAIDFFIEPVAIQLDFWSWEGGSIPLSNYFGWFITSLVIQAIYQKFHFEKKNPVVNSLLIGQLIFFITLFIYFEKTIMY